eukprot:755135-Hanusia_phi.AAC.2
MGGGSSRPRRPEGTEAEGLEDEQGEERRGARTAENESTAAAADASTAAAATGQKAFSRVPSNEGGGNVVRRQVTYPKEVLFHARELELNPEKDEKLMWIAEKAANDRILPPWGKFKDKNGRIYYSNIKTKRTIWQSPYMEEYRKLIKQSRKEILQVSELPRRQVLLRVPDFDVFRSCKADPLKQEETIQRAPSTRSAHEQYYVASDNKIACIVPDLHSKISQLQEFPESWSEFSNLLVHQECLHAVAPGINRIKVQGSAGLRGRKVKWYHASLRCCQIPFVAACFELTDFDGESDPRLGEKLNDGSQYNGHTILSLDLSGQDTSISNCFFGNPESILSYGGIEKLKNLQQDDVNPLHHRWLSVTFAGGEAGASSSRATFKKILTTGTNLGTSNVMRVM